MSAQITDTPKVKVDATPLVQIEQGGCCKYYGDEIGGDPGGPNPGGYYGQGYGPSRGYVTPPDFSQSFCSLERYDYNDPDTSDFTIVLKDTVTQTGFFNSAHLQIDETQASDTPHGVKYPQAQGNGGGGFAGGGDSRLSNIILFAPFVRGFVILSNLLFIECQVDNQPPTNAWGRFLDVAALPFDPLGSEVEADWDEDVDEGNWYQGFTTQERAIVRTWGRTRDEVGPYDGSLVGTNTYADPVPVVPGLRRIFSLIGVMPS